jgi:D-3-phosphoglycerate dehydrogenase
MANRALSRSKASTHIDAEIGARMIYTTNDVPGIMLVGQTMGKHNVNIANFTLGRSAANGERLRCCMWTVPPPLLGRIEATGMFTQVKP